MPTVWIVEYTHKHGTDISVYENSTLATNSAIATVLEYLGDLSNVDVQKQIIQLIESRKFGEAMTLYGEHAEEYFDISGFTVLTKMDYEDHLAQAKKRIEELDG
jgi:hypothetical protein